MKKTVVIGGTKVKYWEFHPDQKEIIIFWHGFRGSHRGLVEVAELLTKYRVIVPDLPGWGESGVLNVQHSFTNYITFLQKFIASLHLNYYILIGHSFGASLALEFAAKCPEKIQQLVLICPVVNAGSFTTRLGELYYTVGAKIPQPFRRKWITSAALNRVSTELITVTTNLTQRRKIVKDEQTNVAYIKDWVEIETFQSFYDVDFWKSMKELTMPTILIASTKDRMTSMAISRNIATTISNCRLVILKSAGHFAPMEVPSTVARAVISALKQASTR